MIDFFLNRNRIFFLILLSLLFFSNLSNGQTTVTLDTLNNTIYMGDFKLKKLPDFINNYRYDSESDSYIYQPKIGDINIKTPLILSPVEFRELYRSLIIKNYFEDQISILEDPEREDEKKNLVPNLYLNSSFFETLFGGNEIELNPQGSVAIDIGARFTKRDNPSIPIRNQSNISLDFNQALSLSLNGTIGTKFKINSNYDSQSNFDFQNLLKLDYTPNEDDIIQKVELGNVSMPLSGSLISGAQSLFGFKTQLKLGKTTIDAVIAEQRSQSNTLNTSSGGSMNEFSFFPLDYESNKHFFLSHFFKLNYDKFLRNYPYINSPVNITRIEVWITNRSSETDDVRNLVAFQDLGENFPEFTSVDDFANDFFIGNINQNPDNSLNKFDPKNIGQNFLNDQIRNISTITTGFSNYGNLIKEGTDYEVLENARKLDDSEYQFNDRLGYISLNQPLENDEVVAVAFQYTINGNVFQVGEFSNEGDFSNTTDSQTTSTNNLILKMLKSTITNVQQPVWKLMMKNIYNLGTYEFSSSDFKLDIFYSNPSPLNYLQPLDASTWPENLDKLRLLNVFDLDKLDSNGNVSEGGDGFFDVVDGVTVSRNGGLLIFPNAEPFGEFIFEKLRNSPNENYSDISTYNENQLKYVYNEMYSLGKTSAEKYIEKNKFNIRGKYKANDDSQSISTGEYNIPNGSVVVTAGGRVLQEGVDYLVNYQTGDVQILNESLKNSNIPIEISTESNSFFSQQKRRFTGINFEHIASEKFKFGGSLINLSEKSITRKSNYGFEPVNNTAFGLNFNYFSEIPILTSLINKIPNINTDVPSNISVRSEFAYLKSSKPRSSGYDGSSSVYLDDFEGTQNKLDLRDFLSWKLSSVPVGFKGYDFGNNDIRSGFNRAKLSWYTIDPIFYGSRKPNDIDNNEISKNSSRRIYIDEIFPQVDLYQGESRVQTTLDLTYYPSEKGPYNNNVSEDFNQNTNENWAGIFRKINTTNFQKSNVEYIQFWILDNFSDNMSDGEFGEIVFHLGNISEDILPDGKKQYENGLPVDESDTFQSSVWGNTPSTQSIIYAFNNIESQRQKQDLGYDGLDDDDELNNYSNGNPEDPAGDNYEYYLQRSGSILNRYKNYNGTQGNSPTQTTSNQRGSTNLPDVEDVNNDNTMNRINSYFEYRIPIRKYNTKQNNPFISDVRENTNVQLANGSTTSSRWLQFKIPIFPEYYEGTNFSNYFDRVNGISDLKSIRFIRMVLNGFQSQTTLRFATLDLIKTDWKRYTRNLNRENIFNSETNFEIGSVNILDNENRKPINYVLPPGVEREELFNNNSIIRQNEQSLSLKVQNLKPKDLRAVYKNIDLDLRHYKKIKMFVHAESLVNEFPLPGSGVDSEYDKRLVAFLRIGDDVDNNFYQIEVPLKPTSFNQSESSRFSSDDVWNPDENSIDFDLEKLLRIKLKIIEDKINNSETIYFDEDLNLIDEFSPISSLPGEKKYKFSIKGNPSLARIRTISLGLKNPSTNIGDNLSGEVWFNELRLSDIKVEGGWAAVGNIDANLADFADISFSGRISSSGFGSIDKSPNEMNNDNYSQYNFISNVNAGQILPPKWGIQIPISYTFSKEITKPKYDGYYSDLTLDEVISVSQNKDSVRNQSSVISKSKSFSVLGLSKRKINQSKKKFYDIENFNFSYAYNETDYVDFETDFNNKKMVRANGTYSYNFNSEPIFIFKKLLSNSNSKYLDFIKNININPLPNNLSFSGNFDRLLNKQKFREINYSGISSNNQIPIPLLVQANYMFRWSMSLSHNLTNSLNLNYNATNDNIINVNNILGTDLKKDDLNLFDDFLNIGDVDYFNQNLTINYSLPLSSIPYLDFIQSSYTYSGNFNWQRGSDILNNVTDSNGIVLGNISTIQNSNNQSIVASLNFDKFYRNFKFLNKKNTLFDMIKGLKRFRINYTENSGKVIPGYTPKIGFFGTSKPTLGFVFGNQRNIRYELAKKGYLTNFSEFNEQFQQVFNSRFEMSAEIQLFKNLKIDLNANRNYSNNYSENYRVENTFYQSLNPNFYGNFSISSNMLRTSFNKKSMDQSDSFDRMKENLKIISLRLINSKGISNIEFDDQGFPIGFGKNSQEVLIPSFISAYTGTDVQDVGLNPISDRPKINWSVQYDGLSEAFKDIFSRISLRHSYRSNFTINNFQSNLNYNENSFNSSGNYESKMFFSNINLVEQFNPLIQIDLELKNSLRLSFDVIKDRAISLSLANNLITESWGNEYSIGLGYRARNLKLWSRFSSNSNRFIGDLNTKLDFNIRKNLTVIRNLNIDDNKVSAGQSVFSLRISADYALNRNFSTIFFYDHLFSKYEISTAFPQTNIRSGFTLRYNFGN